ncbi:hypothetical protein MAH1_35090 [Sessilibacter sp. MAH1]
MKLIELDSVSLAYRGGFNPFKPNSHKAINNLSLTISEGENIGIIGGNGAGKSTLLKILGQIYKPDSGIIKFYKSVRSVFIGLQSGFIPYLNGVQNAELTGLLLGMSKKEIRQKLDEIIIYSELGEDISKPVFTYSAGMRARLAFSISIFSNPDLLLLDEVMGVGDKQFREKSNIKIKEMIAGDSAVVIVSHDLNYLTAVCEKIVHFEKGAVTQVGAAKDIIQNYLSS